MLVVWSLWTHIQKLWTVWIQEPILAIIKLLFVPGQKDNPRDRQLRVPTSVEAWLLRAQWCLPIISCLIDSQSEVTVVEYGFYVQRFGAWEQLDPCWLSL